MSNVGLSNGAGAWDYGAQLDTNHVLFNLLQYDPRINSTPKVTTFLQRYKDVFLESSSKYSGSKDDFETIRRIGRGHFGDIDVVRQKATGDIYALKSLSKAEALSSNRPVPVMVEREVGRLATKSPWLNQLRLSFQDNDFLYLVMEYQPGGDLYQLLSRNEDVFPVDWAKFYLAELAEALHSLHQLGYAHRDIKPENILIDENGHIKLCDFGSCSRIGDTENLSAAARTPEYLAPEVIDESSNANKSTTVSTAEDWWSFGVLAYEMLFGEMPFQGDHEYEVFNNISSYKDTLEIPKTATLHIRTLIQKLLCDKDERMDFDRIRTHPFFAGIRWGNMDLHDAPFVPELSGPEDTRNFEELDGEQTSLVRQRLSAASHITGNSLSHGIAHLAFVGWTYIPEEWRLKLDGKQNRFGVRNSRMGLQQRLSSRANSRGNSVVGISNQGRLFARQLSQDPESGKRIPALARVSALSRTVSAPEKGLKSRVKPVYLTQSLQPLDTQPSVTNFNASPTPRISQPSSSTGPGTTETIKKEVTVEVVEKSQNIAISPDVNVEEKEELSEAKNIAVSPDIIEVAPVQSKQHSDEYEEEEEDDFEEQPQRKLSIMERAMEALGVSSVEEIPKPVWKIQIIEGKRQREEAEKEKRRLSDPMVKYAHLPDWKRTIILRRLSVRQKGFATAIPSESSYPTNV
eukprot:m.11618 g.11618  ORF g.11618 m.11618 type:complete len:687 (-) comp4491_c0_seq1:159-2219(-)